jgi:putative membrane protein
MQKRVILFIIRVITNSIGMYFAIQWFATAPPAELTLRVALTAGLTFSLANIIVKPFLTLASLPFILLTMGLFTIVVNAVMVALTFWILPDIQIDFLDAIFAGMLLSLVNYLVNLFLVPYNTPYEHR